MPLSSTDDLPEGTTNLYYTEIRVSANTDVVANSSARHTHSNKTVLDGITNSGSGSIITVDERATVDIAVTSDTTETGAIQVNNMVSMTQADYDALTPDASTLYIIVG